MEAFLGVEQSITGRRWTARQADERLSMALSQRLGLPEILGRVLTARGIELDDAEAFLNPSLKQAMPDPSSLKDMDLAAERLASAVMQGERVCIFGDYDVDGATSSALLVRFLRAIGGMVEVYIPDRLTEGYGPNGAAMEKIAASGVSVVVTVDCGTLAFQALERAADAGLEVIVADHHAAEPLLPKALAVINPNRLDESGRHRQLAAVGVSFLLVVAVNRVLRQAAWFKDGRTEPNLMQWLDLVALGTVCDVVPLTGLNRVFVAQGLKVMAQRRNLGLSVLSDVAGLDETPGTYHAGFLLGPRINAGGRIGAAALGSKLLATEDRAEAQAIADRLDRLNRERQDIEQAILMDAVDQAEKRGAAEGAVVLVGGDGWHPGVVGIVASRLKDRFNRPALVVGFDGEQGTGSGRSIPGVDLGAAVIAARQAGILSKGGGHAMAAGFSLDRVRLDDFDAFLRERLGKQVAKAAAQPGLSIDGAVQPEGATLSLMETLDQVGPFGVGNPEPRFVLPRVRIGFADSVGKDGNHVKLRFLSEGGGRIDGICFRAMESDLGPALLAHDGGAFHVAGKLRVNEWQGRRNVQMLVDDAASI